MGDTGSTAAIFAGEGEMRARCRAMDWTATPLGPVDTWPQSLRTAAEVVLSSAFPHIVLWGPELIQIYNDGYIPFLGAKHPWGLGVPTQQCWPEAWAFNRPIYERVLRGETVSYEDQLYRLRRRGPGQPADDVYITLSYSPVHDDQGAAAGVIIALFETTAQVAGRRFQAELAESEARHRLAVDAAEMGTWEWDPETDVVTFDPRVRALFSLAADAPIGRGEIIFSRVHVDDAERVAAALAAAADPDGRGRYYAEFRVVRPDGSEHWVSSTGRMLFTGSAGGRRPLRLIGTVQDITERREADAELRRATQAAESHARALEATNTELRRANDALEDTRRALQAQNEQLADQQMELELANTQLQENAAELEAQTEALDDALGALRASEVRFRNVLEQAPLAVAVLEGPDHVYTLVSPRYAETPGNGRRLLGRSVRDVFPELAGQGFAETMDRVYATGEPYAAPERVVWLDRDGDGLVEEYFYDVGYQPLRDSTGAVYAIASVASDVTDKVRARREVEAARQAAEHAGEHLTRTFAQAPVAIAVLEGPEHVFTLANPPYTRMVGNRALIGLTIREAFPELADQGIYELLDRVRGTGEPFQAEELRLVFQYRPGAEPEERVLNFSYQPLRDESGVVYAIAAVVIDVTDQVRGRELAEDAIKFTEPGGRITVGFEGAADGVRVHVRDTGRGIPPEQIDRIFDPFVQVDRHLTTESQQGVGLGLTISRDLARGMGGDLGVESTPGLGSLFTLRLSNASG